MFVIDCTYEVCSPSVVGEVIDGEAIIMDLSSGAYYSTEGVGSAIWKAIEDGASHGQLLKIAEACADSDSAAADIVSFLEDLLSRKLIRKAAHPQGEPAITPFQGPYASPSLAVHEDMQDLILLDPIHDVNEMGWPTRKADA